METFDSPVNSNKLSTPYRVWLCDLTYTQQMVAAEVMPMAIGSIACYLEDQLSLPEPVRLFKYPEKLIAALDSGAVPDIIGFSSYCWNHDLGLQFARLLKEKLPDIIVIMGGPHYPVVEDEQAAFLRQRPMIDFFLPKEGEIATKNLLVALTECRFDRDAVKSASLPSIHCVDADGNVHLAPTVERLRDFTQVPSPYLTGKMDEFFDGVLMPLMQTNRGCPFSCTFCVEGQKYYTKIARFGYDRIADEIELIGAKMKELRKKGGRNDLFIADSNFGMFKEDITTCRKLRDSRHKHGWPEYINVATGKNQKERVIEATSLLEGALRLSGSVQSLDSAILENVQRKNISADQLMELGLQAKEIGVNSYSEIILGLPGDSKKAHFDTVRTVMEAGFNYILPWQLMMLPGADISTEETRKKFGMKTKFRALPRCYGHFEVLGERIVAVEVEEVCIGNETLSFDDYLECRRMNLATAIFYNDGVFLSLIKLLRLLDQPIFPWFELMMKEIPSSDIAALFDEFTAATLGELRDDREEMENWVRNEKGVVERFITGELGSNLLYLFKSKAITKYPKAMYDVAQSTFLQHLENCGIRTTEIENFVNDALNYQLARISNIFTNSNSVTELDLVYDTVAFEKAVEPIDIESFRFERPVRHRFYLTQIQRDLIDRYLGIYGHSELGIARTISRVYAGKLFRTVERLGPGLRTNHTTDTDDNYLTALG